MKSNHGTPLYALLIFVFAFFLSTPLLAGSISQSAVNPISGCPYSFTTTLSGTQYYWNFGPTAVTPMDSGSTLQSVTTYFLTAGTVMVRLSVNTFCCGPVEDSLLINIQSGTSNIALSISSDTFCFGVPADFTASPVGYQEYNFFVNDSLIQSTSGNFFQAPILYQGDSIFAQAFDAVCYTNKSPTIYPHIYPTPASPTLISSINDTICSGDTVVFTASGGYEFYQFYNGGSLQQDSTLNSWSTSQLGQNNNIRVRGSRFGCLSNSSNLISLFVQALPFIMVPFNSVSVCQGESVTIAVMPRVDAYDFYLNSVLVQAGPDSLFIADSLSGNNLLTIRGEENGCFSYPDTIKVAGNNPGISILSDNLSDTICKGQVVTYTAVPNSYSGYVFYNDGVVVQNSAAATYAGAFATQSNVYVQALGCSTSSSDTIILNYKPVPQQELCIVTCDTITNQNIVVWEKSDKYATDSFYLYRASNPYTVYTLIAALNRDSLSEYEDISSSDTACYRYKILLRDTCGNYSQYSEYHQTIHLTYTGNGIFQWTSYEIENSPSPVSAYEFYRDPIANGNWELLASIPTSQTSATDADYALYPSARYKVVVRLSTSCNSSRSINELISNILVPATLAIGTLTVEEIKLLKNPVQSEVVVVNIPSPVSLQLFDGTGRMLQSRLHIIGNTATLKTDDYSAGLYYLKILKGKGSKTLRFAIY